MAYQRATDDVNDFPKFVMKSVAFGFIAAIAVLFVILPVLFGSWYTVKETDRVVVSRLGAFQEIVGPGLHFKFPWIDSVTIFDVSNRTVKWIDDGDEISLNPMEAYSFDSQATTIQLSIGYHITDPEMAYRRYKTVEGLEQNLIMRNIPQDVKVIYGKFTAQKITQTQGNFITELEVEVRKRLEGAPIAVDFVNVEDVAFSKVYEESVERRMLAEVKVEEDKQQKISTITKAEGEAESKIKAAEAVARSTERQAEANAIAIKLQAEADAERVTKLGLAEASAIKARVEALGTNPEAIIRLTNAERWNGSLPSTMLPNSTVPFLDLSQTTK